MSENPEIAAWNSEAVETAAQAHWQAHRAFEVTEAELAMADTFEAQFDYRRVNVTLASGNDAWVFLYQRA